MKRLLLFLVFPLFFLSSCEEIAPIVKGATEEGGEEPEVKDQKRQVLIEEFTGVRCVNCPAGSAFIEDLLAANAPQLIAVSIHAGEFAPPYPQSLFDFRTTEGDQLLSYLGEPFGYPTAVVNRKKYEGQFDLQLGQGEWAGYITEEKEASPKVRIDVEPIFNGASRELKVQVSLFIDEEIAESDVRLSVMITESGLKDLQLTPASSQPNPEYGHKHVLRGMMTNYDGFQLNEPLVPSAKIEKSFTKTLPDTWREENCKIIAFVSLGGEKKDVLQAHQVDVIQ